MLLEFSNLYPWFLYDYEPSPFITSMELWNCNSVLLVFIDVFVYVNARLNMVNETTFYAKFWVQYAASSFFLPSFLFGWKVFTVLVSYFRFIAAEVGSSSSQVKFWVRLWLTWRLLPAAQGKDVSKGMFRCAAPACRHGWWISGKGCRKGCSGEASSEKEATHGGLKNK